MNLNLTNILQNPSQTNQIQAGPNSGRQVGVVLEDTATVTWLADGFGGIQATAAAGAALPTATAAGQVPTSTGPGTTYTAQAPVLGLSLIQKITADGTQNSYTISSIPQTFNHLMLIVTGTNSSAGNQPQSLLVQFNGDTGNNYSYTYILGSGSVGNTVLANQSALFFGNLDNFGGSIIRALIGSYSQSAIGKAYESSNMAINPTFNNQNVMLGGYWNAAAAITSIKMLLGGSALFISGAQIYLYGF